MFFELDGVTATTILLTWGHPFDDGGTPINDMELSYTEIVPKDNLGDADKGSPHKKGLGSNLEEKHHKFLLGSYMEEYMMIDLRGDNDYKDIQLVAINKDQYRSEPVEIKLVRTKPPSMRQRLQKELQRAKSCKDDNIDTDFYTGFMQRENCADYIARIEADLAVVIEQGEEDTSELDQLHVQKNRRWKQLKFARRMTVSKKDGEHFVDEDAEAIYETIIPGYATRKVQFTYRVKKLEEEIVECERIRVDSVAKRVGLANQMRDTQTRIIEVQGEIDRVHAFKGESINSNVMHGTDKRFDVHQLKLDLEEELEKCLGRIAMFKQQIIKNDRTRVEMISKKAKKEEHLHMRIAAFSKFQQDAKKAKKVGVGRGWGWGWGGTGWVGLGHQQRLTCGDSWRAGSTGQSSSAAASVHIIPLYTPFPLTPSTPRSRCFSLLLSRTHQS